MSSDPNTISVARLKVAPLTFGHRTEEAQQGFKVLCGNGSA